MTTALTIQIPEVSMPAPSRLESLLGEINPIALRCIETRWRLCASELRSLADDVERAVISANQQYTDVFKLLVPATPDEISQRLLMFVSAWPNASGADLAGYGAQLIGDVVEIQPCRYALGEALKKLRRTSRFLPSIAELVIELLHVQKRASNLSSSMKRLVEQSASLRSMADDREAARSDDGARADAKTHPAGAALAS